MSTRVSECRWPALAAGETAGGAAGETAGGAAGGAAGGGYRLSVSGRSLVVSWTRAVGPVAAGCWVYGSGSALGILVWAALPCDGPFLSSPIEWLWSHRSQPRIRLLWLSLSGETGGVPRHRASYPVFAVWLKPPFWFRCLIKDNKLRWIQ